MKNILLAIGVVFIIGGFLFAFDGSFFRTPPINENSTGDNRAVQEDATVVAPGVYAVDPAQSTFQWAGKKPFIDGYVNSGTINFASGEITVDKQEAHGIFTLAMDTLRVGLTAQKPGQEGVLEGHLKGERWFDVATHPTAQFVIRTVETTENSETTFEYTVTGDLTLKGITNEISFLARIYQSPDGFLHAEAETEIDRTRWDLTLGSGNFFENVGDNLIADEVALSFSLVATLQK